MSVPPLPPPLQEFGPRPFSFYPPVANVVHNEWRYRKATWSEVLVQNTKTLEELWVPRIYLGSFSSTDEPVMIVGLLKELECRSGMLLPVVRRVIEMPRAVNDRHWRPPVERRPAPVVGIRVESGSSHRAGKVVLGGVAVGIISCVLAASLYRGGVLGNKILFAPVTRADLGLNAWDDYDSVTRLLGRPVEDRTRQGNDGSTYRLLGYPRQGCFIMLYARAGQELRYIGALDRHWIPVHAVPLPGGGNSYPLLHDLPRF